MRLQCVNRKVLLKPSIWFEPTQSHFYPPPQKIMGMPWMNALAIDMLRRDVRPKSEADNCVAAVGTRLPQ